MAKPRCRHPKSARKKTMAMTPMVDALGFYLRWTEICASCKGQRPLGTRKRFLAKSRAKGRAT